MDRRAVNVQAIRGRLTPPNASSSSPSHSPTIKTHDLYSIPRPTTSSSQSPPNTHSLYNAPRAHQNGSSEHTSHLPPASSEQDNLYNVPKLASDASGLYNVPRQQGAQNGGVLSNNSALYNIPPSRAGPKIEHDGTEIYNVPRPATEAGTHQNGHEFYSVPRRATEVSAPPQQGDGLYNVPQPSDAAQTNTLHNIPRSHQEKKGNYNSLETAQRNAQQQLVGADQVRSTSVRFLPNSRLVRPNPRQDLYSIPRTSNPSSPLFLHAPPQEKRYEDIDMSNPRYRGTHTLKPSRSLESLVHRRVNTSTNSSPSQFRAHRTPPPHNHTYIEVDINDTGAPIPPPQAQGIQNRENLYAEIPEDSLPRRSSHPSHLSSAAQADKSNYYTTIPSDGRMVLLMNNSSLYNNQIQHTDPGTEAARALHKEGYELCLPADDGARSRAVPVYHTPPRSIPRRSTNNPQTIAQSYSAQSTLDNVTRMGMGRRGGGPIEMQLSSSGPSGPNVLTDEYVIVTRQGTHQPSQPRDIPAPQLQHTNTVGSPPLQSPMSVAGMDDQYMEMSSAQLQVRRQTMGSSNHHAPPPVPVKHRGSVGSSTSLRGSSRSSVGQLRDSLDLDILSTSETGSQSTGSCNHLDDLESLQSPLWWPKMTSVPSAPQMVPTTPSLVRIASGSPHDITPSRQLK